MTPAIRRLARPRRPERSRAVDISFRLAGMTPAIRYLPRPRRPERSRAVDIGFRLELK
jgi:hypothetical protein